MRRAAVLLTVVASFALIMPAISLPVFPVSQAETAMASPRAERRITQISNAIPAANVEELRQAGVIVSGVGSRPSQTSIDEPSILSLPPRAPAPPRTYTVQSGDNYWSVSRQYGVTVEQLAEANRLPLNSILRVGQELTIPPEASGPAAGSAARPATPPRAAVVHVVSSGETLWEIANRYGTRVENVMVLNDLGHSDWIKPGQRLIISGQALPRYRQIGQRSRSGPGRSRAEPVMADTSLLQGAGAFLWPSRGMITSPFGWRYRRHHDGIDVASPSGTPIYAARDGVVEFSGWRGGYGMVVFLTHGDGLITIYGHASELLVQPGEHVRKGQMIARVGCTGACTGSHLHFEVRVSDHPVDPLQYFK